MQESMTAEQNRVRALLDEVAACRSTDPARARKLALQARVQARAVGLALQEAEAVACSLLLATHFLTAAQWR